MQPALPTSHPHPDIRSSPAQPSAPPHPTRWPANLHPSYICRHADNQKSGQAAFEGAEGKGKTFPLEMQLDDLMRGATRACAVCERCSELKAPEAARVELFPLGFLTLESVMPDCPERPQCLRLARFGLCPL